MQTVLPSLKILKVDYNNLTILDKDFHGLPVLCQAHLRNNQIISISHELVAKTNCMNHNVPGKLELYLEGNFVQIFKKKFLIHIFFFI